MRLAAAQKNCDRGDRDVRCHERIGDDLPAAETAKSVHEPVEERILQCGQKFGHIYREFSMIQRGLRVQCYLVERTAFSTSLSLASFGSPSTRAMTLPCVFSTNTNALALSRGMLKAFSRLDSFKIQVWSK